MPEDNVIQLDDHRRDGYRLRLAFDTDDPEFARGFEAGAAYARLSAGTIANHEALVAAANVPMMLWRSRPAAAIGPAWT